MGGRLTEIVADSRAPAGQAAFWSAVLGYHVSPWPCRLTRKATSSAFWVRWPARTEPRAIRSGPGAAAYAGCGAPRRAASAGAPGPAS